MDIVETKAEGLSRTFEIKVPVSELEQRLEAKIEEIRPQMSLKGFRPGKVPASHVRRMFGKSIMGDVVEEVVKESNQKTIDEKALRVAGQPDLNMESDMEAVLSGEADLAFHIQVDLMPDFEPIDPQTLTLERPVAELEQAEIDEALGRLAEQNTRYEPREAGEEAEDGDAVIIDFVGRIDGEIFEGGTAENQAVVLGGGRFIPGFEEQLAGVKAGDEPTLEVTFPEDYPAEALAGKPASFEVRVQEVRAPETPEIDDEFAQGLGAESLENLTDLIRKQLQGEFSEASRAKAKRKLLDALDEAHDFDLPPKMVEQEFNTIWDQVTREREAGRLTGDEAEKSEDALKADYRAISERRVRLGLVLAEMGRRAEVQITEAEVQQALIAEARKYPGQERQVVEFYQKSPTAMAELRAPIYEDKVVDHILALANVTDVPVSKDELFREDEAPDLAT